MNAISSSVQYLCKISTYGLAYMFSPRCPLPLQEYYPKGKRWWFRPHEESGKFHEVPANPKANVAWAQYSYLLSREPGPHTPALLLLYVR